MRDFEQKLFYKVCYIYGRANRLEVFVSASILVGGFRRQYRIGKRTKAMPGSLGLFVFSEKEDAMRFAGDPSGKTMAQLSPQFALFSCRVLGPVIPVSHVLGGGATWLFNKSSRRAQRCSFVKSKDRIDKFVAPSGTYSVQEVTLERRIL